MSRLSKDRLYSTKIHDTPAVLARKESAKKSAWTVSLRNHPTIGSLFQKYPTLTGGNSSHSAGKMAAAAKGAWCLKKGGTSSGQSFGDVYVLWLFWAADGKSLLMMRQSVNWGKGEISLWLTTIRKDKKAEISLERGKWDIWAENSGILRPTGKTLDWSAAFLFPVIRPS